MSNKLMRSNFPQKSYSHPLTPKTFPKEPTALDGKKVHEKRNKNKPTYSNTLNNYETIRNLVSLNPSDGNIMPAEGGKKKVSIKV